MYRFTTNPPCRQVPPRPIGAETNRGLHARIIRHMANTGMTESRFGRCALNDPAFVGRLRDVGYQPTPATMRRVLSFMEARTDA